jgi:hypothetical protein
MAPPTTQTEIHPPVHDTIAVKVDYLAATKPFHDRFPRDTPVETVRLAAMEFFGVADHQDRDQHIFRIHANGSVVTDTSQPISNLVTHGSQLHCDLVEEIIAG